jgi:hypothetical protein
MTWLAFLRRARSPENSANDGEPAGSHYRRVRDLSVRLTNGERIDLTDAHGRRWRATRDTLRRVSEGGEWAVTVEGDAFDVAAALARLMASPDKPRTSAPAYRPEKPTTRSGSGP